jgi:protein-disulfide isomerase
MSEETKTGGQESPYAIPAAILVAGLLIAGAIVYTRGTPSTPDARDAASLSEVLVALAEEADVSEEAFASCLESGRHETSVEEDEREAGEAGAEGTPNTIVIGPTGERYVIAGAQPIENVRAVVERALAGEAGEARTSPIYNAEGRTDEDHARGAANAPVTIIEYSDLDCPFCQRLHPTLLTIMQEYEGEVAWVYRHLPLEQLHPNAPLLAEASECVAELGGNEAFWKFVDGYFSSGT